jgi:uncharacterized protein (TIGR02679 family)
MNTPPDGRLQRLLGAEPLVPLRKRLRQRFERGALDENIDRFRLSNLTVEEHSALASLQGRPVRLSSSMEVDVHAIDAALQRAGIATSLREALEKIDGPIVHIETSRRQLEATWSGIIDSCGHPGLAKFLRAPVGIGLLKRLSGRDPEAAAQLCGRADRVLESLPVSGMTRAQLAADTLGDAHALDNGQPTATIVLAVWRQVVAPLVEVEDTLATSQDDGDVQHGIKDERARDVWARAGVLVNELARPALFLNLSASCNRNIVYASGEPSYASLRLLLRSPPCWTIADQDVFVCENPNLVAIAADELGERCAPMVCTEGMPAAAQRTLLTQLVRAGARLRYHGDFDWPGLRIGNHVMREFGARPWHFGVSEYTAAVQSAPRPGHPLRGTEVLASWDEALSAMMRAHQLAIAEESVAATLLQDLDG